MRKQGLQIGIAVIVAFLGVAPIVWFGMAAFRPRLSITASPPTIGGPFTTQNFAELFRSHNLLRLVENSLALAFASSFLTLLLALLAAGYFLHREHRWRRHLLFFLLSTKLVPLIALSLPMFVLFTSTGLRGSLVGLVIAHTVAGLPLAVWLVVTFLDEVPVEISWAGQLDGLSAGASLWRVALPAASPGIAAAGVFTFIFSWNDYLLASLLSNSGSRPLMAELPILVTQGVTQWGQLCAAALIAFLPVMALAVFARRFFVDGITAGALKKL